MTIDASSPWWLVDGEERALASPRSYFIPPAAHRTGLVEGRLVKLGFVCEPRMIEGEERAGERLWVRLTSAPGPGYVGVLQDDPSVVPGLRSGDEVAFEPRHVVAIDYLPGELGFDPAEVAAVDPAILLRDQPPTRVVRLQPPGESGPLWFLALDGDVPPEAHLVELGRLTDLWPELAGVFRAGDGDWLRHADQAAYVSDTAARRRLLALAALANAAGLVLAHPVDPGAAEAEARFETVVEAVLRLHWPGTDAEAAANPAFDPRGRGPAQEGRFDGISHPRYDRADGRIKIEGKAWVRDGPDRTYSVDVSPTEGGEVRLSPPMAKSRRGRRTKGAGRELDDWQLTLQVPAAERE